MNWSCKRDRDNQVIPRCWITDSGYTVAECRLPETRYPITRPGGALPFAYAKSREEVIEAIVKDMATSA